MINQNALANLVSQVSHRGNSKSWIFTCPKCGKPDKLYMLKAGGRFCCWICKETEGYQGAPEFALRDLLNRSIKDLRRVLYGDVDVRGVLYLDVVLKDFFDDEEEEDEEASELQPRSWPLDYYPIDHKHGAKGLTYLQGRGVDLATALRYDIRYCPLEQRVCFPIASQGVLYGWQARSTRPEEIEVDGKIFSIPKILTTKGLEKEDTLMFADRLVDSPHAVLCEGPFDGIKCDLIGGNVATMGKAVSRRQLQLLRNSGIRKLYLGLDRDAAMEALRLAKELSDLELYLLLPLDKTKDLGASTPEENLQAWYAAPRFNAGHVLDFTEDFETVYRRQVRLRNRPTFARRAF